MACITRRRDRWVVDFYDQTGARRWKTLKQGTTKAEAKEALRRIEDQVKKGVFLSRDKTPTFAEVAQEWLQYKKTYLRENTFACYALHVRYHFDEFDALKIDRITTPVIEAWIGRRLTDGRYFISFSGKRQRIALPRGASEAEAARELRLYREKVAAAWAKHQLNGKVKKPIYTPADVTIEFKKMALLHVRKLLVSLGQIFSYAVRHRLIESNPVRDAERPRKTIADKTGGKIAVLSPEQIRALLDATPDQKYRTLFTFAIMTGAREGECLGLKWSDLDFEKRQVHIRRTFNHQRFFDPKTHQSLRKIDLAPVLVRELAAWKLKTGGKEDELVFPNEFGQPMNYSNLVQRHFQPALTRAEIPRIRFHDLRHTYASLLLAQGENVKYIQTQLGHSSPSVTMNVYAHLMKDENPEAACRLENAIFAVDGSKMVAVEKKGSRREA